MTEPTGELTKSEDSTPHHGLPQQRPANADENVKYTWTYAARFKDSGQVYVGIHTDAETVFFAVGGHLRGGGYVRRAAVPSAGPQGFPSTRVLPSGRRPHPEGGPQGTDALHDRQDP